MSEEIVSDLINDVKKNIIIKSKINNELEKFSGLNLAEKAQLCETLVVERRVLRQAAEIMGNTIYDLDIENERLRHQIGVVDKSKLAQFITKTKINDTPSNKNSRIKERLQQQMLKIKSVL